MWPQLRRTTGNDLLELEHAKTAFFPLLTCACSLPPVNLPKGIEGTHLRELLQVFSFTNPGGKYVLDLGVPYDRSLCRQELLICGIPGR